MISVIETTLVGRLVLAPRPALRVPLSARRVQLSEQYLRTRAHDTHAKNSRPHRPHQSRYRIWSTLRSASGCRKLAQIEQTVRHGHYRRALRKYARCEGLGAEAVRRLRDETVKPGESLSKVPRRYNGSVTRCSAQQARVLAPVTL